MLKDRVVTIVDSTLRDGEQSSGIVFNAEDKIEISKMLVAAGIKHIEAGCPAISVEEKKSIQKIMELDLPATIYTWNRALIDDIKHSIECNIKDIFISIPVSDILIFYKLNRSKEQTLSSLVRAIEFARHRDLNVVCGLEDFTRADIDFTVSLIKQLEVLGVQRIRLSDTLGLGTPESIRERIEKVRQNTSIPIEFHGHNDFGLAVANSLAAFQGGADYLDATLLGIGERAGNTPVEELALAMQTLYHLDTGIDLFYLQSALQEFEKMLHTEIWPWKPFAGEKIFTHESGTHSGAIIEYNATYEPYPPGSINRSRSFTLGKHSGTKILKKFIDEHDIAIENDYLLEVLARIKSMAYNEKKSFSESEAAELIGNIYNELKLIYSYS